METVQCIVCGSEYSITRQWYLEVLSKSRKTNIPVCWKCSSCRNKEMWKNLSEDARNKRIKNANKKQKEYYNSFSDIDWERKRNQMNDVREKFINSLSEEDRLKHYVLAGHLSRKKFKTKKDRDEFIDKIKENIYTYSNKNIEIVPLLIQPSFKKFEKSFRKSILGNLYSLFPQYTSDGYSYEKCWDYQIFDENKKICDKSKNY